VVAALGAPLRARATLRGETVEARSATGCQAARGRGLDEETLRDKLCALGGTPFRLASLKCRVEPGLFVPTAELKTVRRALVEALEPLLEPRRTIVEEPCLPPLLAAPRLPSGSAGSAALVPLCRTDEQLEAVIEAGIGTVVLDWMEMVGLGRAVARARAAGLGVGIATVRIQKPGEEGYDRRIERLGPDEVLVRHWGGVMHFAAARGASRPRVHGDFSLNVTNSITASHLLELGLDTVTASHDLDERQLLALLERVPADRLAVTVHHHIPTFHTEHCVYSNTLSRGRDFRTCGRPCEQHRLALRDRVGLEHPVIVDVGCRNTVFNARAQSAASLVPRLAERGVTIFRVEFVGENRSQARTVLEAYQALLRGEMAPSEVVKRVGVHEQFGVTRGTMQVLR
jgi:putative protease